MLKNKYFIGILAILCVVVGIYNWRFFRQKNIIKKGTVSRISHSLSKGSSPPFSSLVEQPTGNLAIPLSSETREQIKNKWKAVLKQEHWGRNPFLTPLEAGYYTHFILSPEESEKEGEAETVSAIVTRDRGGVAVVNHKIVSKGDWLGGEQIVEIRPDRVILKRGRNRRTIFMKESTVIVTVK